MSSDMKHPIFPSQDELRRHMFEKHPKPGDETVVFPSQAMDPEHLLDTGRKEALNVP